MKNNPWQTVTLALFTLAVALATTSQVWAAEPPATPLPSHVGIELEIAPHLDSSDTFLLTASIRDLRSGTLLSSPRVQFKKGHPAKARTGLDSSDSNQALDIVIMADVDEFGRKATCESEVRVAGQVIAAQRTVITLPRS